VVVDSLVKTFKGEVKALDGVSFEIPTGTVLGLLGPNGAGKTTSVRVLTTLLRPDSGRARVAGVDVLADPEKARTVMGLAGQYAAVDESLTGMENLILVGRLNHLPRPERKARAAELLEQFGLTDAARRTLKTYSGGMRRRLDLAAALVARPPVLFLDEPTTGLDPRSRLDLWAVIEGLVADGVSLLLTTQYLEEADRLADRICVIDHGRVIAEGTATELKAKLGGTAVEIALADDTTATKAAECLQGIGDAPPTVDGTVVRVATTTGLSTTAEVVRRLESTGLDVVSLQLRQPSLDEVFLSLTGHAAEEAPAADTDGAPRTKSRRASR
jgi:ABC-2 type transport system ATP-binding protein